MSTPQDFLPNRRKSLAQMIQDMQAGIPPEAPIAPYEPSTIPSGPEPLPPLAKPGFPGIGANPAPMDQGAAPPKFSDIIRSRLDQASAPPTRKQSLLQAIAQTAPIAVGGLLGGTTGAYGASQGIEQAKASELAQGTERRKELQAQLEAEKNREERGQERQLTVEAAKQGHEERLKGIEEQIKGRGDVADLAQQVKALGIQQGTQAKTAALDAKMQQAGFEKNDSGEYVKSAAQVAKEKTLDDYKQASTEHQKALSELAASQKALADSKNDPLSPAFKQAQQRIDNALKNANATTERLDLSRKQFEANIFGTVGGQQIPGGPTDEQGKPIGLRTESLTGPTTVARTKADQAKVVQTEGAKLKAEIDANPQVLGALKGQWSRLERGLGADDPAVSTLYTHLKSFASLQPGLHGTRGVGMQKEFERAVGDMHQSAGNLKASIDSLVGTAQSFKDVGNPRKVPAGAATHRYNPATGKIEEIAPKP